MRILIVGAGLAGLTAAALLSRQGHRVAVLGRDKERNAVDADYPITLWPHGSRVLNAMGVYEDFRHGSLAVNTCLLYGRKGKLLNLYDLAGLTDLYERPRVLSRSRLLRLLENALCNVKITTDISIKNHAQVLDNIELELSDGTRDSADLLIIADGADPKMLDRFEIPYAQRSTGWSRLSWSEKGRICAMGESIEIWGAGCSLSACSYEDKTGLALYLPSELLTDPETAGTAGLETLQNAISEVLRESTLQDNSLLKSFSSKQPIVHPLSDRRHPQWVQGRVVLLGDAAISYLPGTEVGASMALESAAVLADELSRTNRHNVSNALNGYVRRRKSRCELVQNQSRAIMAFKLARSPRYAKVRDTLIRFHDMQQLLGPKLRLLTQPI